MNQPRPAGSTTDKEMITMAEEELARLQRQLRIMEDDRVAFSEETKSKLEKQRKIIHTLKNEKQKIVEDVTVATCTNQKKKDEKLTKDICRLLEDYEKYERNVRSEREQIQELEIQIKKSVTSTTNSVICSKCYGKLQQSYDFKTTCLKNNKCLKTIDYYKEIIAEIPAQYKIKGEDEACKFCLKYFHKDLFTKLNELEEDIFLRDMFTKCVPEIDLNVMNDASICQHCMDLLQNQFNFMINCSDTDERIKDYALSRGANKSNDEVDLSDVLKFNSQPVDVNCIKVEKENENISECGFEIVVKKEQEFEEIEDSEFYVKLEKRFDLDEEHDETMSENCIKIEESSELNSDHEETVAEGFCKPEKSPVQETETLQKNSNGLYVCAYCPHQTNRRDSLAKHLLRHKSQEEASQFKCKECNFVTKWNSSLRSHLLLHKNPVELELYYCANCSYKSMHKKHVRRHCKRHMTLPSKSLSTYQCQFCSLTSKDKNYFKLHNRQKHNKNIVLANEDLMCEECDYQSRDQRNLKNHMKLMHKIVKHDIEPPKYTCEFCDYKARKLDHLQGHLLKHKSCDEVEMLSCSKCAFQSKYKNSLRTHLKIHESGRTPRKINRKVKQKRDAVKSS